jgi:hypothetical protein
VRFQESIGLDILVHGEPERNDMVQYFGELLNGFVFTQNAWVQSYGSRYVHVRTELDSISFPPLDQLCPSAHRRLGRQSTWSHDRQVEQLRTESYQETHEGHVDWPCYHP